MCMFVPSATALTALPPDKPLIDAVSTRAAPSAPARAKSPVARSDSATLAEPVTVA